jgi:hypothetical protein
MRRTCVIPACQPRLDAIALASVIAHEGKHAEQYYRAKTGSPAGNIYSRLDTLYGGVTQASFLFFVEAEAELGMLNDSGVGWHWLEASGGNRLGFFDTNHSTAVDREESMSAGETKTSARGFLQDLYTGTPFVEMKRSDYDRYVRPPQ